MYQFNEPQVVAITVLSVEQLQAVYAALATNPVQVETYEYPKHADAVFGQIMPELQGAVAPNAQRIDPDTFTGDANSASDVREAVETLTPELDSDGLPFDASTMTGTRLKTGQWRMKNGVERPSVAAAAPTPSEPSQSAEAAGTDNVPDAVESLDEDDEFAAFRNAAINLAETAPAAAIPARSWTDADLTTLTNQAASKMGADRVPQLKAIIAEYCPEGVVSHSRHVPSESREALAQAIEAWADIEFAG